MRWVEAICLCLVTAAVVFLFGSLGLLVQDVRHDEKVSAGKLNDDLQLLNDTLLNVKQVTLATRKLLPTPKEMRQWQTQEIQVTQESLTAIATLNADLRALNISISTGSSLIDSQAKSLPLLEGSASKSIETMASSVASLQGPSLETLQNLQTATANLAATSAKLDPILANTTDATHHLDAIAADSHEVADHYRDVILHPVHTAADKIKTVVYTVAAAVKGWFLF